MGTIKFQAPVAPGQYDADALSEATGLRCADPSLAQQHQADEADINTIVKRFGLTGQLPVIQAPPLDADFDEVLDFHTAQNLLRQAQMSFNSLPADARNKFGNDPGEFVNWWNEQEVAGTLDDAARALGFAPAKPAPSGVQVAEAPAAPAEPAKP